MGDLFDTGVDLKLTRPHYKPGVLDTTDNKQDQVSTADTSEQPLIALPGDQAVLPHI